eukprot:3611788-Pleurochrysis_carterae.AAC.4
MSSDFCSIGSRLFLFCISLHTTRICLHGLLSAGPLPCSSMLAAAWEMAIQRLLLRIVPVMLGQAGYHVRMYSFCNHRPQVPAARHT